ncbi:hypothetical protein [Nesterenkonia alba]|uniref:hypothetical protein n=1 Tax=Nesterenkonia alba TaxID=515814 RepID=UPI0003B61051|nr:hypothetical protein [Nesterenkonia alba]
MTAVSACALLCLLSACGDNDTADTSPTDDVATEGQTAEGTTDPANEETDEATEEAQDEPLERLEDEEFGRLLLSASDLPESPDEHSTHRGAAWLEENIAVESTAYRDNFGDDPCAEAMDEVNPRLVGEHGVTGQLHEYRRALENERSERIVVWGLGFEDGTEPDSDDLWDDLLGACSGDGLENDTETITVTAFEHDPFRGMTLRITPRDNDADPVEFHSATAEVGQNLVMVSAANVSPETFEELIETQIRKINAAGE